MEGALHGALTNPDYQMYKNFYNVLTQKGQHQAYNFMTMLMPFDQPNSWEMGKGRASDIDIPVYTGSGQYAIDYHFHWLGAQHWFTELKSPKKLSLGGPAHQERPFHSKDVHNEALKWYDYWLKGIDTGVMDEPAVRYWVTGENKWRYAEDYPIPETQWTAFYLDSWERMRTSAIDPFSWDGAKEPDAFVQSPPTLTNQIAKLRYMTDPLAEDTLVAGPISMNFWAAIDSDDTNWIVTLKDVGPDCTDRTGRKGETEIGDLPVKYLTKGFLKASMREIDPDKSTAYEPWNKLTPDAKKPVIPGEINEYNVAVMAVNHIDNNKCIKCGRCVAVCTKMQAVSAICKTGEGSDAVIAPSSPKGLAASSCVNCGQCVAVCPVGALTEKDSTREVEEALADPNKFVIDATAESLQNG